MDDLQLLRDMRSEVGPAPHATLARGRQNLMKRLSAEQAIDPHSSGREVTIRRRRGLTIVIAGAVVAGAAAAVIALVPTPDDNSQDASRIIASLSRPQQETDKPPAEAMATINKIPEIDPSQIRLLGQSETLTYYGAPAGDKICMFPVDASGEGGWVGCTLLKNFESYGLRADSADRTEAGWLVVPAGAEQALKSVQGELGWSQQAQNFLVRDNH